MSKKRNRSLEQTGSISAARIFFCGIAGLLFTIVLTFFAAFAITKELLPLEVTGWLGPVIIALSSFLSTVLSVKGRGKKLLCGLLAAGFYSSCMLISGLLFFSAPMEPGRLLLSLGALLLGSLGGVILSGLHV